MQCLIAHIVRLRAKDQKSAHSFLARYRAKHGDSAADDLTNNVKLIWESINRKIRK